MKEGKLEPLDQASIEHIVQTAKARVEPMSMWQRIRLAKQQLLRRLDRRQAELRNTLLTLAGHEVIFADVGPEMAEMLGAAGGVVSPEGARLVLGVESDCHENVRSLFWSEPERFVIGTGFALSDDGWPAGHES